MMTLPFKGLPRIHVLVSILHFSNLYARCGKQKTSTQTEGNRIWVHAWPYRNGFLRRECGELYSINRWFTRPFVRRSAQIGETQSAKISG